MNQAIPHTHAPRANGLPRLLIPSNESIALFIYKYTSIPTGQQGESAFIWVHTTTKRGAAIKTYRDGDFWKITEKEEEFWKHCRSQNEGKIRKKTGHNF